MGSVHQVLRNQYQRLGYTIGKHPLWFIVIPFILSLAMFTAGFRVNFIRDIDSVFASPNGRAMQQKSLVTSLYPMNTSYNFNVAKFTERGNFGTVLLLAKDGGNMLRPDLYSLVIGIDKMIRNITVNGGLGYDQICAKKDDACEDNVILEILNTTTLKKFEDGKYNIKYPISLNQRNKEYKTTIMNLGGVTTDNDNNVKEAKAIRLVYFLDNSNEHKKEVAETWEDEFIKVTTALKLDNITVSTLAGKSFDEEIAKISLVALPMGVVATAMMFVFCFVVSMTNNVVKCKPLVGVSGAGSALIAVGTAFGFLIYCGFPCVDINSAIPFLMLGIGVDDTFVLLAAWRRTVSEDDVPKRMSQTFSEAAVSITITSFTNFLSFFIGIFNPYPCIYLFCTYSASAVLFTYVYQITFFGGWMALSGYREKKNLNPFTYRPVKPSQDRDKKGVLSKLLFGNAKHTDFMEWISQELFSNKIGKSLAAKRGKTVVIIIYAIYLFGAIWGCTQVRDGLEYDTIFTDNSYAADYLNKHLKYMTEYGHRMHVAITETLDYSDPAVQNEIENDLSRIESSPYVSNLTTSWLRAFLQVASDKRFCYSFCLFNLTQKADFVDAVKVFLKLPWGKKFSEDIIFNDDGTDIISSRFILTSRRISSSKLEGVLVEEMNNLIAQCKIKMAVHETWFPFYEQTLFVPRNSLVSIAIAAATMTVVFFIFIPDLLYAACVACTVISIQAGAIGYMTFWGVNRDVVSALCLLMSVGFSVDYSAHMINAYATAPKLGPNGCLRDALGTTGVAVCQGSLSTVLGVVFLALVPAEMMRMFFKIVFLVILFSAVHSVFLLPVFLSIADNAMLMCRCRQVTKRNAKNDSPSKENVNCEEGQQL